MNLEHLGMVIAAGGAGRRFGGDSNKLLVEYQGKPVLLYSLLTFAPVLAPGHLVVAAPEQLLTVMRDLADEALPGNSILWCTGGATRVASVVRGVEKLPESAAWIAIHDAARPLATVELLRKLLFLAESCDGAIPGHPPVDTVKVIDQDGMVRENLIRQNLACVGTPQLFRTPEYRKALAALPEAIRLGTDEDAMLTDDAAIAMQYGMRVKVLPYDKNNFKITTRADLH